MSRILAWLRDALLAISRPYAQGHLFHEDGSLYMQRWQLVRLGRWNLRLHDIRTADLDRHLHDHPWNFLSLVLAGGYIELRPVATDPCFVGDTERVIARHRLPGSVAFRRATDRHRIAHVRPGTVTLILTWPKVHWWGFFTPTGKVWWRDYPSCHATGHVPEDVQ